MALKQISDLTQAITVADNDEFIIRQGGEDKRVSKTTLVLGVSHNSTSDRNAVGAHDAIYNRRTTVAEIESGVFITGSTFIVEDRVDGLYKLTSGGVSNGKDILDAGNGNTAVYQPPFYGVVPKQIGAKYDNSTDDTAFNQRAIDLALSIGYPCLLDSGTSINTKLTYYTDSNIVGTGIDSTILKTKDNSNSDLLYSENFDSLVGTNSDDGTNRVIIKALTLDGNRNRPGNLSGNTAGVPLKLYGRTNIFENIKIVFASGNGMHTEWGDGNALIEGLEGLFRHISIGYSGETGWHFAGAHDSHCDDIIIHTSGQKATNTYKGLYLQKGNARWSKVHVYSLFYTDQGLPNEAARMQYAVFTEAAASGNEFTQSHFEGAQTNLQNIGDNNIFTECRVYYPWNGFNIVNEGNSCVFDCWLGEEYLGIGLPPAVGFSMSGTGMSNCDVRLTGTGQSGGWLAFNASNGSNSIVVRGYNVSGAAYTGTPSALDDIDLYVSGSSLTVLKQEVFQTRYSVGEITATGSTQGDAAVIDVSLRTVAITAGAAGAGVRLINPSFLGNGYKLQISNVTGNSIKVYPNSGADFLGYGVDNPITLTGLQSVEITVLNSSTGKMLASLSA